MSFAGLFQTAVIVFAVLLMVGLLATNVGLMKEAHADNVRRAEALTPAARRTSWIISHLPLAAIVGVLGAYVLGFGAMALDSVTDGTAMWTFLTPARAIDALVGMHVRGFAIDFWSAVIGGGFLVHRLRRAWRPIAG